MYACVHMPALMIQYCIDITVVNFFIVLYRKYLPQLMPEEEDVFNRRFEDHTEIGSGGFGTVYKAKHQVDEQYYAVKVTKLDTRCVCVHVRVSPNKFVVI